MNNKIDEKIVIHAQKINNNYLMRNISKPFDFFEFGLIIFFLKLLKIFNFNDLKEILIGIVIVHYVKNIFRRIRPCNANNKIKNRSAKKLDIHSFPSAHSFISFLFSLIIYKKFNLSIAMVIPIMVGFSRINLGVHYLSDVIAGFIFALSYHKCYSLIR